MPVFCFASHGESLRAVIANALMVKHSENLARQFLEMSSLLARGFADVQRWLEKDLRLYHLHKANHQILTEQPSWLKGLADEIYLLRPLGREDHE